MEFYVSEKFAKKKKNLRKCVKFDVFSCFSKLWTPMEKTFSKNVSIIWVLATTHCLLRFCVENFFDCPTKLFSLSLKNTV